MIIAKVKEPHTKQSNKQKGKLEPKNSVIMQSYTFSQSIIRTSLQHVKTIQTIH